MVVNCSRRGVETTLCRGGIFTIFDVSNKNYSDMEIDKKLNWLILHMRYTQALCEIIIEHLPDTDKDDLIRKVQKRVKDIA
jgi:hypothetical protein